MKPTSTGGAHHTAVEAQCPPPPLQPGPHPQSPPAVANAAGEKPPNTTAAGHGPGGRAGYRRQVVRPGLSLPTPAGITPAQQQQRQPENVSRGSGANMFAVNPTPSTTTTGVPPNPKSGPSGITSPVQPGGAATSGKPPPLPFVNNGGGGSSSPHNGGTSANPSPSPSPGGSSNNRQSTRNWSVKVLSKLERGACGDVTIIEWSDLVANKHEIRVMKEMSNADQQKIQREMQQYNRRACHPNMIKYLYAGAASGTNNRQTHSQVQMELMDLGSLRRLMDFCKPHTSPSTSTSYSSSTGSSSSKNVEGAAGSATPPSSQGGSGGGKPFPSLATTGGALPSLVSMPLNLTTNQYGSVAITKEDRLLLCQCVGYQVLMALDYFHNFFGGMHRDIKPANILIHRNGRVKLCDFDTSVADSLNHDTGIGTQSYCAPEVIRVEKTYTNKCDVWSFGAVLFELATGKHPYFEGGALMQSILSQPRFGQLIKWELLKDYPESFIDLLEKCFAEDPEQRFSASDALNHRFFDEIVDKMKRDVAAERQLKNEGVEVDSSDTMRMMKTWRKFVDDHGGGATRTSSANNANSGAANPGGSASSRPQVHRADQISNVMKSILYNWEYAAVHNLKDWLTAKNIPPLIDPKICHSQHHHHHHKTGGGGGGSASRSPADGAASPGRSSACSSAVSSPGPGVGGTTPPPVPVVPRNAASGTHTEESTAESASPLEHSQHMASAYSRNSDGKDKEGLSASRDSSGVVGQDASVGSPTCACTKQESSSLTFRTESGSGSSLAASRTGGGGGAQQKQQSTASFGGSSSLSTTTREEREVTEADL